jgi:hypothetical protein
MGFGTSRERDRLAACFGELEEALPLFESAANVCHAGVLFLIPGLIAQGLLKGQTIYQKLKKGYYGLVTVLFFYPLWH